MFWLANYINQLNQHNMNENAQPKKELVMMFINCFISKTFNPFHLEIHEFISIEPKNQANHFKFYKRCEYIDCECFA